MHVNFNSINLSCCGGNRFIFELSNRLVDRGYKVTITHSGLPRFHKWFKPVKAEIIDCGPSLMSRFLYKSKLQQYSLHMRLSALQENIPDCDVNVATFCLTAKPTVDSGKGRMFYLVQHYEPLFFSDTATRKLAEASYLLPMTRLCVSKWLTKKVSGVYIGNGINLTQFKPSNKPKTIDVLTVFRKGINWKNNALTMKTRQLLLAQGYSVNVLNGSFSEEQLVNAYQTAKLFVYLSEKEGFGYYPLESMGCGTPVLVSDCTEYIKPRLHNGFVLPKRFDAGDVVSSVKYVLGENLLYSELQERGLATAKKYDFEKVVDRFESCISGS